MSAVTYRADAAVAALVEGIADALDRYDTNIARAGEWLRKRDVMLQTAEMQPDGCPVGQRAREIADWMLWEATYWTRIAEMRHVDEVMAARRVANVCNPARRGRA